MTFPFKPAAWLSIGSDWASEAFMAAALFCLFFPGLTRVSASFTVCWIGIKALRRVRDLPWSWGVLAILLLNIRGIVVGDGPQPASHMDYVLIIIAFLLGVNQSPQHWFRSSCLCCLAFAVGALLNFEVIWDFQQAGVEYQLAVLSKNQTALLAAFACCSGLMAICLARSRAWIAILVPAILLCLLVAAATTSRAAVAIIPLSFGVSALVTFRRQLFTGWLNLYPKFAVSFRLRQRLAIATVLFASLAMLIGLGIKFMAQIVRNYGGENLANDFARLKIYACYAGLPFKGENRFLYGVGYQNSWEKWCTPEVVGVKLTHAHNLFLQVWADTGAIPSLFLLVCLFLAARRIYRNSTTLSWRLSLPTFGMMLMLLGFNSVELGMVKVPFLLAVFGTFMASIYLHVPMVRQSQWHLNQDQS
jgi:hypothetical protein